MKVYKENMAKSYPPQLNLKNKRITPKIARFPLPFQRFTIQSTPALRTNIKIIDRKLCRCNPNRKLKIFTIPPYFHNI